MPDDGTASYAGIDLLDPTKLVPEELVPVQPVEFDAIVVAGGTTATADTRLMTLIQETHRHYKPVDAWGSGADILAAAGVSADGPGVVVGDSYVKGSATRLLAALGRHRVWERTETAQQG